MIVFRSADVQKGVKKRKNPDTLRCRNPQLLSSPFAPSAKLGIISRAAKPPSVKKAFLVTPIKWSRFTFNGEDFYICDFIIDRNVYLGSTDIVKLSYVSDNKVIYEYYNGNYYTEGGDNNIKANDWKNSALFEFANNSFLSTAFTEKQKLILSGNISIPDISYIDSNGDNKTDSAVFNPQRTAYSDFISSSVSDKSKIFTLSPSEEADNKVICSSGNIVSDGVIDFEYGFVPVIKISAD